jgi:hypothetical protein
MFSVRDMTEPSALQHAVDDFYFWGSLRGICRALAFYADIRAFVALLSRGVSAPGTFFPERNSLSCDCDKEFPPCGSWL